MKVIASAVAIVEILLAKNVSWRPSHLPQAVSMLAGRSAGMRTQTRIGKMDSDSHTRSLGSDGPLGEVLRQVAEAPQYSLAAQAWLPERSGEPAAAPAAPQRRPQIEGYELLEELGRGGMGVVYRARQAGTGRLVAVKVVAGRRSEQAEYRRRFEREIRVLARLQHPRIAGLYAAGATEEGDPYFAMELVEGATLDSFLASEGELRKRLELFLKLCEAVAFSHRFGVIHRDLKPKNVLVWAGGAEVKVLDFGLAHLVEPDSEEAETLTRREALQGTLPYMSPEQVSGKAVTTLSDVYALGVMLYELVAGRRPYEVPSGELLEAARVICEERPKPPGKLRPGPPRGKDLDAIVLKALEKEPSQRYQGVTELAQDLESYLASRPVQPRRIRSRLLRSAYRFGLFCRRNLVSVGIGSVAVLALTALALWSVHRIEQGRRAAEQSAQEARQRLAELHTERGRQELANGSAAKASVYLSEAYGLGDRRTTLRFLLRRALAYLDAPIASLDGWADLSDPARAFSADGSRIVTSGRDGTAKVWDTSDGKLLLSIGGAKEPVLAAVFSPDGFLVTSHPEGIRIRDAKSGKSIVSIEEPISIFPGSSVELSPDGSRLIRLNHESKAKIWDARSGRFLFSLEDRAGGVGVPRFSPDGAYIVMLRQDASPGVWDAQTGKRVAELQGPPNSYYRTVRFGPDGTRVLASGPAGPVRIWETGTGRLLTEIETKQDLPDHVLDAVFSADGVRIATAGFDGTVRVWSAQGSRFTKPPLASLEGHVGMIRCISFSPVGRRIVTGGLDGTVRVWDGWTGLELGRIEHPADPLMLVAFSPDGSRIVWTQANATRLWKAQLSSEPKTLEAGRGSVDGLEFSPDGRRIVTAGAEFPAQIWDAETGEPVARLETVPLRVVATAFSPDGGRLVTAYHNESAGVWDVSTQRLLGSIQSDAGRLSQVAFSPDGRYIVAATRFKALSAWDARTCRRLATLPAPKRPLADLDTVVFSPDGSRVLVWQDLNADTQAWLSEASRFLARFGCSLGTLFPNGAMRGDTLPFEVILGTFGRPAEVREPATGKLLFLLQDVRGWQRAVFSPDGSRLLTASRNGQAGVWDGRSGRLLASLDARLGPVSDAEFSPDNRLLVLGGLGRPTEVWDTAGTTPLWTTGSRSWGAKTVRFSPDGTRIAALEGGRVRLWDASLETRSPEEVEALVRCRAPWRLKDGRFVPAEPDAAACAEEGVSEGRMGPGLSGNAGEPQGERRATE
jgi:WD40 repeat protein/serine/threonine protein kinase